VDVATLAEEEAAKEEQVGGGSPSKSTERKPSKNITSM